MCKIYIKLKGHFLNFEKLGRGEVAPGGGFGLVPIGSGRYRL